MKILKSVITLSCFLVYSFLFSQVPILNHSVDSKGQVQLEVASTTDNYYLLQVRSESAGNFEWTTSMTLGEEGSTIITEPLAAYPIEHYQVLEFSIANPTDIDEDGFDDYTEFSSMPKWSPLNFAKQFEIRDGAAAIPDRATFETLSVTNSDIPWAPFLNDKEFTKFLIRNIETDKPELYFINSKTHFIHQDFGDLLNVGVYDSNILTGEFIYHPDIEAPDGSLGMYSFNYSFGEGKSFEIVRKTHELMAANMPLLNNNLAYYITIGNEWSYENDKPLFENSRIPAVFEDDVFANVDYLPLNRAEGFGRLRLMNLDETPSIRDVVLYESLPNTLPRVGGIITSFIQTPLSHVNLRAIQDNLPNAFIRDPLLIDSISNLLDKYVYYKVEDDRYIIREATLNEVNDWFEDIRPSSGQIPINNLSYTEILPLDDISFEMSDGFGAKCANVATMRTFPFPSETIPNGYGIPFYYYRAFMEYNGFFEEARNMIADPNFQNDLENRIDILKEFRKKIKDADMPQWMLNDLQAMHESFPVGTKVRCRSSTNNEDLPGFSGAGLYTSKTQHLDEGHIQKSIKQVYASLWNFRAYEEREFYRIDHFQASMGVLCHPNFEDEIANGVGVSLDPIYGTENTFYLNTQVGEDLITNPNAFSVPEEVLIDINNFGNINIIRYSNLTPNNGSVMDFFHYFELRQYMEIIDAWFATLYNAVGNDEFAMDIEFKITEDDVLVIKQARPWTAYWSDLTSTKSVIKAQSEAVTLFPNPAGDFINLSGDFNSEMYLVITDLSGQKMSEHKVDFNNKVSVPTSSLPNGIFFLIGKTPNGEIQFYKKFVKGE